MSEPETEVVLPKVYPTHITIKLTDGEEVRIPCRQPKLSHQEKYNIHAGGKFVFGDQTFQVGFNATLLK